VLPESDVIPVLDLFRSVPLMYKTIKTQLKQIQANRSRSSVKPEFPLAEIAIQQHTKIFIHSASLLA